MYNDQLASDHIDFIQLLKHTGDFYGRPFTLLPWQQEILRDVYGTVDDHGKRRFQYIYLEIPKKNGKTELTAAIGIDHLTNDPPGGQIYCCAAEKEQASLVYRAAKAMIEQDPYLETLLNVIDSKKEIHNRETGSYLKVLSAESYSKHGISPTVVIFDELHAQQRRDLWDTMTFGSGAARQEPLWWIITTAGDDPDRKSIGWEIHDQARRIKDGELIDPTWYVKIYAAAEDADIYDERVWYECNPSLGASIDIDKVRQEAVKARNSPSAEKLFRWLRLNQWVSLKRIGWLPLTVWDRSEGSWSRESMAGRDVYVGIDLSSKTDLTGMTSLFPPQDGQKKWRFMFDIFAPEDGVKDRSDRDHVPYDSWARNQYLTVTPGGVIDYGYLAACIGKMERTYKVRWYGGDPWHLEALRQLLPREVSRKFIEIPQTMAGMSPAMGELERMFLAGEIEHDINPLGRWTFGNVAVATDGNENKKPMKNRSIDRIDPIVALINAMAVAIKLEKKRSVYEEHGVRMA